MKKKEVKKTKEDKKVVKSKNSPEVKKIITTLIIVALVFGFFYLLTYIFVGDFGKEDDTKEETKIQYDEILAGSSFSMNASKYLVVYYDFDAEDASEILSAIYTYEAKSDALKVYTVDLGNALNKNSVSEKSKKDPKDATELAISGPTISRFRDGMVREYIEGQDKVVDYLSK